MLTSAIKLDHNRKYDNQVLKNSQSSNPAKTDLNFE
jgi:hypothetical protein